MGGPCSDWVTLGSVQADPRATLSNGDPIPEALLIEGISVASEVLWSLSAQQFSGVCSDTVRPVRRYYDADDLGLWWWGVYRWRGGRYICSRPPERATGCGALSEITLGAYPLREILQVRIDGAVVDPTTYRVDDHRWLVRISPDGFGWPCCQQLQNDPMTDLDTFSVAFTYGQAPPDGGQAACRLLAIELAKSASGDECNLPDRVTNITQQGMSFVLLDRMPFLDTGRTGIYSIDLWLSSVNPNSLARRPMVISPDIDRPVRRTSTTPGS